MRPRTRTLMPAVIVAVALLDQGIRAQGDDLQRALDSAAAYLERYERDMQSVVLEEMYWQRVPADRLERRLRSDLVIVADVREGWVELRDVFEVDGRGLGGHADRIVALLSKPMPDALVQARRLADESARFNLNPARGKFQRSVNVPLTTLRFLRRSNQSRSSWQLGGTEHVGGRGAAVLRFEERSTPRLIGSTPQFAARGAFWIDAEGTVLQSELRTPEPIASTIKVSYALHRTLGLWLPDVMQETYRLRMNPRFVTDVEGRATYSNARQFKVETAITVR